MRLLKRTLPLEGQKNSDQQTAKLNNRFLHKWYERNIKMSSFLVDITNTENHTWQGTVTWLDTDKKQNFRSALELFTLIDSAVGDERPTFDDSEDGANVIEDD